MLLMGSVSWKLNPIQSVTKGEPQAEEKKKLKAHLDGTTTFNFDTGFIHGHQVNSL